MKIWHSGAQSTPHDVNGVNSLIYSLAREQSALGHSVTLLLTESPDPSASAFSQQSGVQFRQLNPKLRSASQLSSIPKSELPDIVHFHSVFIPQQWALSRVFDRLRIPMVVTPHAGFSPNILARSRWKKAAYSFFCERPRLRKAIGISTVTPKEELDIRAFLPGFRGHIDYIPNAVDPAKLNDQCWTYLGGRKIVYLGRFDVFHKGIDIMVDLARRLPEFEFHLYGPDDYPSPALTSLREQAPSNVLFQQPVYGEAKSQVLAQAGLYLQTSRWEGFPISIAEAMYLGVPCAIRSTLQIAPIFEENDLGLVLPTDLESAAQLLRQNLLDPRQLNQWSKNSREFARANFTPDIVARRYLSFYDNSLRASQTA